MEQYVLEAKHISKQFPGTLALDDVSVSFHSGAIHAVIGKNGSGKSTLMKIFSGAYEASAGEIYLYGEKIENNSLTQALQNGIATVYQELSLVGDLRVSENIFMGRLPMKNKFTIDWNEVEKKARDVLKELDVDIDPNEYVKNLAVGQQQLVEIAKAMSFQPKVLILDEPTSALSESECEKLFNVVKKLKKKGIIILFISHRLAELYKISDYVTVLRDGKLVGTQETAKLAPKELVNMMFGEVEQKVKPESNVQEQVVLEIKNLNTDILKNVNLQLHKGEILGIAGSLGAGRTEILRAVFGLDPYVSGEIIVEGETVKRPSPELMKKLGLAYTSENRKEEGLCLGLSIGENLCMASLNEISPRKVVDKKLESEYISRQIDALSIKVSDVAAQALSLSGGNQQKIVIGNWLNTSPKIMLMDEPSRGIDVNAKQQIFSIMWEEAKKDVAIIMVSSDLEELIEVCDRILIMRHGRLVDEYAAASLSVEEIYSLCMQEDEENEQRN